jgi:hypothetical protein
MIRPPLANPALNWLRGMMYPLGKPVVLALSQAAVVNLAMALANGDLPTEKMHTGDLWSACAECANARLETVADHLDLQDFIPTEFKTAHQYKNVAMNKPCAFNGLTATAYDRVLEIKRFGRNDMLPLWNAVSRQLGFVAKDGRVAIPSGHQLPELMNAFNEALYVHDQKKKQEAKDKAAGKLKRQVEVKSLAQSGVQGGGEQSLHLFKTTVLPPPRRIYC